jgi:hypothetical protein
MPRRIDQWTTALTAMLVVGALLACKKKTPDPTAPPAATVTAAPTTTPTPLTPPAPTETAAALADGPKLGEVKRYADKEKVETGTARILENGVKVFDEADDKTADVASLDKGLLVSRLASIPDWELVEFPSGVGKVSPGWVLAKFVDSKSTATVTRDAVTAQTATAVVKAAASTTAKTSATAAASAAKPGASSSAAIAKAAADKAAADKAAADKAAADKAAADKAAADKAALDAATTRAQRIGERAAARAKAAADKAAAAAAGK